MKKYAVMTTQTQEKRGCKWETIETKTEEISKEFYNNTVDPRAIRFFRRLGGIETVQRNYTEYGYLPIRILSTSPDRQKRIIKEFSFIV